MNRKRKDYIGKYPVNSRITIDYSKKEPKVSFGYPSKKSSQIYFTAPVFFIAFILSLITTLLLSYFLINVSAEDYPQVDDCITYSNHYKNKTNLIGYTHVCLINGINYTMKSKVQPLTTILFFKLKPRVIGKGGIDFAPLFALLIFLFSFLFYSFLLIKFYSKTKIGNKIFPGASKLFADAHFSVVFNKVPKDKKIEIPLFQNIYLDYKATKEFSKYLTKMEIREHPFNRIIRKGRKKIRKKRQVSLWKATFYFSEIPKDGNLEVWWT